MSIFKSFCGPFLFSGSQISSGPCRLCDDNSLLNELHGEHILIPSPLPGNHENGISKRQYVNTQRANNGFLTLSLKNVKGCFPILVRKGPSRYTSTFHYCADKGARLFSDICCFESFRSTHRSHTTHDVVVVNMLLNPDMIVERFPTV